MQSKFRSRNKQQAGQRPNSYSYYKSSDNQGLAGDTSSRGRAGQFFRLLPAYIAIGVIVLSVLISLTLSTNPAVETLDNQPSPYRDKSEYASAVDQIMSDNLSSRTKLTVNTKEIEKKLLEKYPEISSASLRLPVLGRKPTLVINLRQPALILSTNSQTYAVDAIGLAVSDIRNLSSEYKQGIPVVLDQSGLELELGKQALRSETVTYVTEVIAQIKAKGLTVSQLTMPASANELDIRIEGVPYFVKTDTSGNARVQIGTFFAVQEHLSKQGISPSEYVDVRVEERAFYK